MKELLLQYAKYNIWANKRIIDALLKLEEEKLDMDINSSFRTLRLTVTHILAAEQIWYERLMLVERPIWIGETVNSNITTTCDGWQQASTNLLSFINKQYDDRGLEHVMQYVKAQKSYKSPTYAVLQHVFNHSSYHRGQIITMLRQTGVKKIPNTDLIEFSMKAKG